MSTDVSEVRAASIIRAILGGVMVNVLAIGPKGGGFKPS
jgi:hypothetical protein